MSRSRKWVFTYFGENEPEYAGNCTYLVYGRETCPETNRLHWQGYAEFRNAKTIAQTQTTIACPSAHLEKPLGTPSEAAGYCKKADQSKPEEGYQAFNDDPAPGWIGREFGERSPDPAPGTRSDIIAFRDAIKRGADDFELIEDHPTCCAKYIKFKDFARETYLECPALPRGERSKMAVWLWGPPNIGKSTNHPFEFYEKPSNKWWDGYKNEEFVIVDDPADVWAAHFSGYLKTWVQEKPFRGEIKGGTLKIRFKRLIVMSNKSMADYFHLHMSPALESRFTEVHVQDLTETVRFYNAYKLDNE